MKYRILKFGDKLGINYSVFLTNRMEDSLHSLAENWLTHLPTRKKFDASRLSAKKFHPPHHTTISMF